MILALGELQAWQLFSVEVLVEQSLQRVMKQLHHGGQRHASSISWRTNKNQPAFNDTNRHKTKHGNKKLLMKLNHIHSHYDTSRIFKITIRTSVAVMRWGRVCY